MTDDRILNLQMLPGISDSSTKQPLSVLLVVGGHLDLLPLQLVILVSRLHGLLWPKSKTCFLSLYFQKLNYMLLYDVHFWCYRDAQVHVLIGKGINVVFIGRVKSLSKASGHNSIKMSESLHKWQSLGCSFKFKEVLDISVQLVYTLKKFPGLVSFKALLFSRIHYWISHHLLCFQMHSFQIQKQSSQLIRSCSAVHSHLKPPRF